jgi:hypothetical protein
MAAQFTVNKQVMLSPMTQGNMVRSLGKSGQRRTGIVKEVMQDGRLKVESSGMTSPYSTYELAVVPVALPLANNAASLSLKRSLEDKIKMVFTFKQKVDTLERALNEARTIHEKAARNSETSPSKAMSVRKVTLLSSLLANIEVEKENLTSLIAEAAQTQGNNLSKKRFSEDKKMEYRGLFSQIDTSIGKITSIITAAKSNSSENYFLRFLINGSRTFGGKTRRNRRSKRRTLKVTVRR